MNAVNLYMDNFELNKPMNVYRKVPEEFAIFLNYLTENLFEREFVVNIIDELEKLFENIVKNSINLLFF